MGGFPCVFIMKITVNENTSRPTYYMAVSTKAPDGTGYTGFSGRTPVDAAKDYATMIGLDDTAEDVNTLNDLREYVTDCVEANGEKLVALLRSDTPINLVTLADE